MSRFAKNFGLFLLGFLLFELGRRAIVPTVPWPLEERRAELLGERATCSVLFVGPSYVENQVVPRAFDEQATRIRLDAHACKFGTSGLRGYELRNAIEGILERDWPRLQLVVIDVTLGDEIGFEPANWLNPRVVEWHTLDSVPWLLEYYGRRRNRSDETLSLFISHAKHLLAHYSEVGRGVEALRSVDVFERLRPEREPVGRNHRPRKERLRGAAYERHVARMIENRRHRGPRYGGNDWALELRSLVRAHGKEAYFLIAPVLFSPKVPRSPPRDRDRLVVFDFNDPIEYPELYTEDMRGNTSHLSSRGSLRYSALLANELKKQTRRKR